jgi:uncharacterized membrane protein
MSKILFSGMIKKGVVILFLLVLAGVFAHAEIETKSVLLKFSLNKGESLAKNITFSSGEGGIVDLSLEGIPGGVSLGEESVSLDNGEEKSIAVYFNSTSVGEGAYVGNIKIAGKDGEKMIPVIFEVESRDVFFDGNLEIPSKYSNIAPGGQMTVQLNVFDLLAGGRTSGGLGSSSVDVEYSVHDLYGNTLISEKENFVVDTKVTVSKTISFPEDMKEGQYVFSTVINYRSSIGVATDVFTVSKGRSGELFNISGGLSDSMIILLFFGFIFVVLILFFVYIIHDRDRLVMELRRYNAQELEVGRQLMREQEKVAESQGQSGSVIKREIESKIRGIKKRQEKRVREFKELHKRGSVDDMRKRLDKWKKQGYDTTLMEYKLKALNNRQMKEILERWKREYKH